MKLNFNSIAKIIFINLSVFAILILILELFLGKNFRSAKLISPYSFFIPNLICGRKLIYDASPLYDSKTSTPIIYDRDSDCYRSRNFINNNKIILTIGGSTTDQRFLSEGETFQDILDKKSKFNYDFINGGVDGQSSYGHLISLRQWHSKVLDPKLVKAVVFYIGINDRSLINPALNNIHKRNQNFLGFIKDFLNNNSYIYSFLKNAYLSKKIPKNSNIMAIHGNKLAIVDPGYGFKVDIPDFSLRSDYDLIIKNLVIETETFFPNSKVVIIQQQIPGCRFVNPNFVYHRFSKFTNISSRCLDLGKVFLSMDEALKSFNDKGKVKVHKMYLEKIISDDGVYDNVHTNKKGSRQIANYIFRKLFNENNL